MPGLERNGASFGISTNRAQYPALNQQSRSFGKMGFPMASGPVGKSQPLKGGSQAAGMLQRSTPSMPRSGGMVGDSPVFKARPPAGGVTGTLPGSMPRQGYPRNGGGGGIMNPRPVKGGSSGGGFQPIGGGPPSGPIMPRKGGGGGVFQPIGGGKTSPPISNPFIPRSGGPLGSGMKGGKQSPRIPRSGPR